MARFARSEQEKQMASISVTGSAFAGLGVIARHPGAVLTWGLVMLVLSLAPILALAILFGPDFLKTIAALRAAGDGPISQDAMSRMMQLQSGMMLVQIGGWLWSTFIKAVICAAVFRAVLEPGQSRGAFLRLGAQELWLTLLFLVVSVLAYIVAVIAALGVLAPAFIVGLASGAQAQGTTAGVLTAIGLGLVAVGVLVWLGLRLSMAAPLTFAHRQFRLFESWPLTAGAAWRLLGVAVLSLLLVFGLELIVAALALGAIFAAGGPPGWLGDPVAVQAVLGRPPLDLLRQVWPWLVLAGALWALIGAALVTLVCAPWAAAYAMLTR